MSNGIFRKTGKIAKDAVKQAAKRVAQEPVEILKHAREQTVGSAAHPPMVEEILKSGNGKPELTSLEKEELKEKARKRLQELQEDLKKEHEERLKKIEEWRRQQEELMKNEGKVEIPHQLLEPVTKRKRGFLGFVKKKQGTKEMGKPVSG